MALGVGARPDDGKGWQPASRMSVVGIQGHTPPPVLQLQHISKRYAGALTPAVADLSLEIQEGEIFTLLGPSGCGKTTTLRIVAGLEVPDKGVIYFKERPIVDISRRLVVPPEKRNIGMVFQSYAIWPHMTVEENVAYPLKLRGTPRKEIAERVRSILELVGLAGLEKRPAPFLSGGQQQRVALARALVYEPSVLLLDEPFSNLDTKLREQMRIELKLLQARLRMTVLFVTHDQVEALSLSNRIGVMDAGRLQQVGSPRELYEQPANTFVRDFLGKTVLLRGVAQASDPTGQVAVVVDNTPDCVLFGRACTSTAIVPGTPVYLAARPEDVDLLAAGSAATGAIHGTIEAVLFVGERTEYRVNVPNQGSILVYGSRRGALREGQAVQLRIHPESASVWPI
ncbi:MAG TPA: ABC transporter ATP-binding protein [Chloroflexota bacterium]|nr:ABC transporter ATP-binding protein [Chloroflexota bacterium]